MKLYIWEGKGISSAYHDDGTLVVLAVSPEQARSMVRGQKVALDLLDEQRSAECKAISDRTGIPFHKVWGTPEGKELLRRIPWRDDFGKVWDGSDEALDREPDRVIDLDAPTVVAFNGGGYD